MMGAELDRAEETIRRDQQLIREQVSTPWCVYSVCSDCKTSWLKEAELVQVRDIAQEHREKVN